MAKKYHDYHLVDPSPYPLLGAFSGCCMFLGLVGFIHNWFTGWIGFAIGLSMLITVMCVWWKDVIKEAIQDKAHTEIVKKGLRIGMLLFIFSEVMFFFVFFWSFFDAWLDPVYLTEDYWPTKRGQWPPEGIETLDPWKIPFTNTLILLLSGTTAAWGRFALINKNKKDLIRALGLTVLLGHYFHLIAGL